jgi:hypothetical protein
MTEVLRSYGDVAIKQDVLGLVEILTARENWFLNNLGKTVAISTIHSTLTDTLRTAASAAVEEGADFTELARTTTSLITNYVAKEVIAFKVDRTQQLVQHYYGEDELARQTAKGLAEWGNAVEFDLVRSTLASGVSSGTAQTMGGILQMISKTSNTSAHTSGTVFSTSILNAIMKDNMDNSNGDVATDLFVGSTLRNQIDEFTNKSNTLVTVNANEILNTIDVYTTSFGRLAIHYHRYVEIPGTDTTTQGRVLGVRPEKLKIAYLRRPFVDDTLQRAGDYDFRAVVGDLTLEVRNKDSNFFHNKFLV